jgi:hypothetical protein
MAAERTGGQDPHMESPRDLRELAAFRAEKGLVVSLFLGFDPKYTLTGDEVATRLASLVGEARRAGEQAVERLGRVARTSFEHDLEHARDESLRRLGPASVACFADSPDGLWRSIDVRGPLPDLIRVGTRPHLLPVVAAPADVDVLVAAVGRERGEIYELRSGRIEELADLSEDQPRRHRDAQAWQQKRLERHVDELARAHLHMVSARLDALMSRGHPPLLVLAGEQEHTSAFAEMLSQPARAAVVGTVHPEAHAGPAELAKLVVPVLEGFADEEERHLVERWVERSEGAVRGWADTLAAASDSRVELLLFRGHATATAFECPSCGRGSVAGGTCPLDGAPLEPTPDALELAVRLTLAHGGTARAIHQQSDLDASSGIGALVTF